MVEQPMQEMTYRDAVREALRAALRADPKVFLMGEDVGRYGGCFAVNPVDQPPGRSRRSPGLCCGRKTGGSRGNRQPDSL